MNKTSQKKGAGILWLLPLVLAVAVIPLITVIHTYDCGLEENPWFSYGGKLNDFFLYYKSFFFRLIGVIVLFILAFRITYDDRSYLKNKKTIAPTVAIGIFGIFSLLSALLADHRMSAFFGGYEQFEGWFVLLAYIVCFFYAFGYVRTEKTIRFMLDVLLIGSCVAGLLGTFQAMGLDWIQSDWAKPILTAEMMGKTDLSKFNIRLNFGKGMSYVTFYNPNYVGSYVALMLPIAGYLILCGKRLWRRILAGVTAVLLIVTLLASRSLTGILGILIGGAIGAILLLLRFRKYKALWIGAIGAVAAGVVAIVVMQPSFFKKMFSSDSLEEYYIESMSADGDSLIIRTGSGHDLRVAVDAKKTKTNGWGSDVPIRDVVSVTDDSGQSLSVSDLNDHTERISETNVEPLIFITKTESLSEEDGIIYELERERVTGESQEAVASSDDTEEEAEDTIDTLTVMDGEFTWRFTMVDKKLMIYNDFGRLDTLDPIEKAGFDRRYYFASRRGYIWSRTFPMLRDHLLIGAGADQFVYAFPNDDYVGKRYMRYNTQTITKPHDMFLQIWVQDGLPALLAFLFLFGLFLVRAFRMCLKSREASAPAKKGTGIGLEGVVIAIVMATTGYMVVGLANDSTITVAPVYWVLLGVGYAVEMFVSENQIASVSAGKKNKAGKETR